MWNRTFGWEGSFFTWADMRIRSPFMKERAGSTKPAPKPTTASARFELTQGQFDRAKQDFEEAIKHAPDATAAYLNWANCARALATDQPLINMRKLQKQAGRLPDEGRMCLEFALGKVLADIGEREELFQHLLAANALARRLAPYDEPETLGYLSKIREVFAADLMRSKGGAGFLSELPVFVVGMPRSGTTLVEQILASHPDVFGAGELRNVHSLASSIQGADGSAFPTSVTNLSSAELAEIGQRYVTEIETIAPSVRRITNKMPSDFAYAGFLHLILPRARIIHMRRNPLDTALSCFSHLFRRDDGGLGLTYSYDLASLGRYYRAYRDLMAHWRKTLPRDVLLEVDYEDLVRDFDAQARRIVSHCALPWDDACASFYRTIRPVATASAAQVRRPIYNTSIGRWRPNDAVLQPLLDELKVL